LNKCLGIIILVNHIIQDFAYFWYLFSWKLLLSSQVQSKSIDDLSLLGQFD